MPFEHVPQDQFIINSLARLIASTNEGGEERSIYNSAIGFGVDEIVRHNLRQLSQQRGPVRRWRDLLEGAIERSAERLQQELDSHQLRFNLEPYLGAARKSLESAAKELFELNRKLIESREQKRIAEKSSVTIFEARRRYEVSELGLLDSVEGFLATPSADVAALNIERIRDAFPTEGEWFPFEVSVEDLVFVIDDDGGIFVSTENFPREVLDRARAVLHRLAEVLYS
jgi:hypothetical protein